LQNCSNALRLTLLVRLSRISLRPTADFVAELTPKQDVTRGIKLEVRTEVAGGVAVYRIVGRLDALTSPNLESAVGSALSGGNPRIIFDMAEVAFVSSAGLRVILKTAKQAAAAKGGLVIFGLQSAVNEVFEISGLQKFIPVASDETEARSRLGG
jgi:anti-anti-sigma factor